MPLGGVATVAATATDASPASAAISGSGGSVPAHELKRLPAGHVVPILALLMGVQPITTDLYLPALPAIKASFGGAMGPAQLTLSALILAFGLAQLVLGPVSDRYGRRPVLLGGLALYAVAAFGSAAANSAEDLVAWRVMQGVGMAAAVVCGRAMVRDLFEAREGARVMSKALTGLGVIALTSPVLGGIVASAWGWRIAFIAGAVYGMLCLALIAAALPETLRRPNPRALHMRPLWATWRRIASNPSFLAWTLLIAFTYGSLYAFLASSSFVLIEVLGSSRLEYGLYLAATSSSYIVGTVLCRHWLPRYALAGTVKRGAAFSLAAGVLLGGLALAGVRAPWAVVLPTMLFAVGHGIHQPCGQAAVTAPFPSHAGAASALAGFVMSLLAFGIGVGFSGTESTNLMPFVLTQAGLALLTAAVGWSLVQRHGHLRAAALAR